MGTIPERKNNQKRREGAGSGQTEVVDGVPQPELLVVNLWRAVGGRGEVTVAVLRDLDIDLVLIEHSEDQNIKKIKKIFPQIFSPPAPGGVLGRSSSHVEISIETVLELPLGLLAAGERVELGEGLVEVDVLHPGLPLQHLQLLLPGQAGEVLRVHHQALPGGRGASRVGGLQII